MTSDQERQPADKRGKPRDGGGPLREEEVPEAVQAGLGSKSPCRALGTHSIPVPGKSSEAGIRAGMRQSRRQEWKELSELSS